MKLWAIRNKHTKLFIPTPRTHRGFSWETASSSDKPRLHWSKRAAQNALTAWLAGTWKNQFSGATYFEPPEYEGPAPFKPSPDDNRKREEMEIVEFSLEETLEPSPNLPAA